MDHKLCKDCKGYCCDNIGLDFAPHELQNSYREVMLPGEDRGSRLSMSAEVDPPDIKRWQDIHLTYPMLEFLYQDNIHPDGDIKTEESYLIYHYRCKHHNKKTGDCDIYEERPGMCRTFPDSGFCGYRKVKDKEVIKCRPKWFKNGLTQQEWINRKDGNVKKDKRLLKEESSDEYPTEDNSDLLKRIEILQEKLSELTGEDL